MILKLKDILSNPFRDLKTNPLIEEKIAELVGSISLTGFWDNVVVRKNADGKYELAYGHHRLAAAIRAGLTEADFIVKKLDDATMIQIMDNENRDTYGSTPASLIESISAIVKALAAGTLVHDAFKLDPRTPKENIRIAPSFKPGGYLGGSSPQMAYTALSIAVFLGRTQSKGKNRGEQPEDSVIAALNALHLKERGRFSDSMLFTKDRTGAKVSVTTNELLRITADIKRDVERVDNRTVEAKKAAAEFDKEQRAIQAKLKAVADKEAEDRAKLVEEMAKAEVAEQKKKVKEIQAQIAEKEKYAFEKKLDLEVRAAELDKKVEQRKVQEAEAKKEDAYLPIKREAERILHKLEGDTSTTKEALVAEIKSLARQPLNGTDRERLRQAALNYGTWYIEWAAQQFLPPFSTGDKKLNEYRSREAANRRAEEAKAERAREKAERKAAKEKKVAQSKK